MLKCFQDFFPNFGRFKILTWHTTRGCKKKILATALEMYREWLKVHENLHVILLQCHNLVNHLKLLLLVSKLSCFTTWKHFTLRGRHSGKLVSEQIRMMSSKCKVKAFNLRKNALRIVTFLAFSCHYHIQNQRKNKASNCGCLKICYMSKQKKSKTNSWFSTLLLSKPLLEKMSTKFQSKTDFFWKKHNNFFVKSFERK